MPNVDGDFKPVEVSLLWDPKQPANKREVLALKSYGEEVLSDGYAVDDLDKSDVEETEAFQETVKGLDEQDQVKVKSAIRMLDSIKEEVGIEYEDVGKFVDTKSDNSNPDTQEKNMSDKLKELIQSDEFSETVKDAVQEVIDEEKDQSPVEQIQNSDDLDEETKETLIEKLEEDGQDPEQDEGPEQKEKEDLTLEEQIEKLDVEEDKKEQLLDLWQDKSGEEKSTTEKLQKELEKKEKRLKRLEDEKKEKEFTEKYREEFKHLPIKSEDSGKLMKDLDESLKEDTFEKVENLLKSADEALKESEAFEKVSEESNHNISSSGDLQKEVEEFAEEEGITKEQAQDRLMKKNPDKFKELYS